MVEFEFAPGKAMIPEQCARLVETFAARLLFKSGEVFGLTLKASASERLLADTKNLLQVAYFSSKLGTSSAGDGSARDSGNHRSGKSYNRHQS
jgi:hypothetical protein